MQDEVDADNNATVDDGGILLASIKKSNVYKEDDEPTTIDPDISASSSSSSTTEIVEITTVATRITQNPVIILFSIFIIRLGIPDLFNSFIILWGRLIIT